jgi:hypothetical protein
MGLEFGNFATDGWKRRAELPAGQGKAACGRHGNHHRHGFKSVHRIPLASRRGGIMSALALIPGNDRPGSRESALQGCTIAALAVSGVRDMRFNVRRGDVVLFSIAKREFLGNAGFRGWITASIYTTPLTGEHEWSTRHVPN